MRCLVDSDVFAYSCGFATQKTENGVVVVEPEVNALAMCKTALTSIYEEVNAWLGMSGERVEYLELFLTGKDNFRDKLATIRGYKANRKDKPKPVHYQAIRDYMVRVWKAKVVNGHEADDQLAIESASLGYDPDRVMICSLDKDLLTVPGLVYNFKKKWAFNISEQEALANFYRQMVTGDSSDNIGGVYKAGKKAAEKIEDFWDEAAMWGYVLQLFEHSLKRPGCPYSKGYGSEGVSPAMLARAAAIETGRLLHLLRYPGEVWHPPTERSKT